MTGLLGKRRKLPLALAVILPVFLAWVCAASTAWAAVVLDASYPYSLGGKEGGPVYGGSTLPLYLHLQSYDVPRRQPVSVTVTLPAGFRALPGTGWQPGPGGRQVTTHWVLPAHFGQNFDLLYLEAPRGETDGIRTIQVDVDGGTWREHKTLSVPYRHDGGGAAAERGSAPAQGRPGRNFSWYIQSVTLPVDSTGARDDRKAERVLYLRDMAFEGLRNRVLGDGATSWSAVYNHPAAYVSLQLRNPQRDVRLLRFKAELVDRRTGRVVPGLTTAAKINENEEYGWNAPADEKNATTAMISLNGSKDQTVVLPLYVDYFHVLEGDYVFRVTVWGNGQEKATEVPLRIEQKNSLGLLAVGIACGCFLFVLGFLPKLKQCIFHVGARGAITIALFAAVAFGGITVPTTVAGELLHAMLGPFAGFVTGLLSGVFQYLLLVSLVLLYRRPGVPGILYLMKFFLGGLLFGNFTPLGLLSCCVTITVLEGVFWLTGFYGKREIGRPYMALVATALGLADALLTFLNMEQIMFFYRLYYADWYLALYMLVNGFLYSSVGAWLGYGTGRKLRQITGE